MAARDPTVAEVDDPELEANLIRTLSIIGKLGRLRVLDVVLPTVSLGDVVTPAISVEQPAYTAATAFTEGIITAATAGQTHADTGQLAAGIYDLVISLSWSRSSTDNNWSLRHRNAADNLDLTLLQPAFAGDAGGSLQFKYAYVFALNERLRIQIATASAAGERTNAFILGVRRT